MAISDLFKPKQTISEKVNKENMRPSTRYVNESKGKTEMTSKSGVSSNVGEDHPFDFDAMEQIYLKVPFCKGAVDKFVNAVVSTEPYIDAKDPTVKEKLEYTIKRFNLNEKMRNIMRDILVYGNAFVEIVAVGQFIKELKILNPKFMYVRRDKETGQVVGYTQLVKDMNGQQNKQNVYFAPNEIIHIKNDKIGDLAYGFSMLYSVQSTITNKLNMELSMAKIMDRKANDPYVIYVGDETHEPSQTDINAISGDLQTLTNCTEWVLPYTCKLERTQGASVGEKYQVPFEHNENQLFYGLQTAAVLMGQANIPEGLAKVQMKVFEREVDSKRQKLYDGFIHPLFFRVVGDADFDFEWEELDSDDKWLEITNIQSLLGSNLPPDMTLQLQNRIRDLLNIPHPQNPMLPLQPNLQQPFRPQVQPTQMPPTVRQEPKPFMPKKWVKQSFLEEPGKVEEQGEIKIIHPRKTYKELLRLYKITNGTKRGIADIVEMTPDEFLQLVEPVSLGDADSTDVVTQLKESFRKYGYYQMGYGTPEDQEVLDKMIWVTLDKSGNMIEKEYDGRKRMMALKELKVEKIPVVTFTQSATECLHEEDDSDVTWVTMPNGAHVPIGADGEPKGVIGKDKIKSKINKKITAEHKQEAKSMIKQLPEEHSNLLSGNVKSTNSNVAAMVDTENGDLFIGPKWIEASDSDKVDLLNHEVSHVILKKNSDKMTDNILKQFEKGFDSEPKFDKDPFEDMTDSIAAYIQPRYHDSFKEKSPLKFKAIDTFMKSINNKVKHNIKPYLKEVYDNIITLKESGRWSVEEAENYLTRLEEYGIKNVQWAAIMDERTCELCAMEDMGEMSIHEARGRIPLHPNCRCAWLPAFGESDKSPESDNGMIAGIISWLKGLNKPKV